MLSKPAVQPRRSGRTTRVPERLIDAPVIPSKRRRKLPKPRKRDGPPTLSLLEQLPPEILQEICVLSNNYSFPGTSPTLVSKLSCEYIYMHFCFDSFFSFLLTEEGFNLEPKEPKQTWLFARRWMTWPIFQKHVNRAHRIFVEEQHIPNSWIGKRWSGIKIKSPEFNPSDGTYRIFIRYPYLSSVICEIPPKLLRAPFTPDNIAFLRFLISSSDVVRNEYNLYRAWKEALHLENVEMVSVLLTTWLEGEVYPSHEDLEKAIRKSPCPRPILKLLITKVIHGEGYVDTYKFNYPQSVECVEDAIRNDGENRDWLLDWMAWARHWQKVAPSFRGPEYWKKFSLGERNEDKPMAVAQLAGSKRKRG